MWVQDAARTAGIVALLANVPPAAASQQAEEQPHIVVAVLNEADTPAAAIRSAQANLIVVFEAIGVAVVCVDSYAGDHSLVVVRIVGEEATERLKAPPGSIGLAPPTSGNERAWFAYVFYDRIERVADRNRVDTSAMLAGPVRRFKTVALQSSRVQPGSLDDKSLEKSRSAFHPLPPPPPRLNGREPDKKPQ